MYFNLYPMQPTALNQFNSCRVADDAQIPGQTVKRLPNRCTRHHDVTNGFKVGGLNQMGSRQSQVRVLAACNRNFPKRADIFGWTPVSRIFKILQVNTGRFTKFRHIQTLRSEYVQYPLHPCRRSFSFVHSLSSLFKYLPPSWCKTVRTVFTASVAMNYEMASIVRGQYIWLLTNGTACPAG